MLSEKLIPVNIMARRLRVPVAWLKGEAEAGRIPAIVAGRQILVSPDAVESALANRAATAPYTAEQPAGGVAHA